MQTTRTLVMIYSLAPSRQARDKQVFGSRNHQAAVTLFDRLEGRIQSEAGKTGMPTMIIYDHQQPGTTFGERYAAAFTQVFSLGYDQVISVGNDIPALSEHHILQAKEGLESGQTVFGPSRDGGDYLIALSKSAFEEKSFASLPWRTDRLHETIIQLFDKIGPVICLEYLVDIDTAESLADTMTQTLDFTFRKFLRALLKSLVKIEVFGTFQQDRLSLLFAGPRRAPPQSTL
ncbi:MAG: DUF2064 domain-containing protein [Flavobacteriales bacterium]|nr:DUF2064 domain-containing protein [Flavobacteriales bacterium]